MKLFKDLYQYRELLKTNVQKEIRGKYKGAWLGIIWSFLNPLLMLLVYSLVFPYIMRVQIPNYTMFLMTALMPWNFFTQTVANSSFAVIASGSILKKVYFPREILPISVVLSNVVNFLITFIIIIVFLIISGVGLSWTILLFPLVLIVQTILMFGIAFILSSITVYARDVEHIVNVIVMALFYGTPIVYTIDMLPAQFQTLLQLNPMTSIIGAYRDVLFYQKLPDFASLGIVAIVSVIIMVFGLWLFRKLQRNFVEEL
ncbi:MAG TPA: ABC transporter permease [Candidatus Pelethosoma merdigallinarum]|nr:ABC transporter permease [Candidatus Pelethosoma merdigallinarum]